MTTNSAPATDRHARFRELVRAAAPGAALVDACERLRDWLARTLAERERAVEQALMNETAGRLLLQAKPVVSTRIWRETVPADTAADAFFAGLQERLGAGTASAAEQRYVRDILALEAIADRVRAVFPALAAPPAPPDPRQEALTLHLVPVLQDAIGACDNGRVTPEALTALQQAIVDFDAAAATWSPPLPTDHAWWLGMARYTVGRAALELGELATARAALVAGIADFERAHDSANTADMRARVAAIDTRTRADFDVVATKAVMTFRMDTGPLPFAAALDELAEASNNAGDSHGLSELAKMIAAELEVAGYPDPETDLASALAAWVETAACTVTGDAVLARLCEVGMRWARVMMGREAERRARDTDRGRLEAARAEACLHAIAAELSELGTQAELAHQEVAVACSEWFGQDPPPAPALATGMDRLERERTLAASLLALRDRCNTEAVPSLLEEADRLIAAADALGSRLTRVRARLERAYVALALSHLGEVHTAVAAAHAILAPGRAATLDGLSSANEQDAYITGVTLAARAYAAAREPEALIDLCRPVLGILEAQRSRVNTPYQRAAFLGRRAELYELVIASADKLGRPDLLLASVERLKASGAQRVLHRSADHALQAPTEPPPGVEADVWREAQSECARVDLEFRLANDGLARLPADGTARDPLLERRRLLAGSRAITHARLKALAGDTPTTADGLSVSALQSALAVDEAAISWCWLGDDVLLVVACTREQFVPVTVVLTAPERALLVQWQQCVSSLGNWELARDLLTPEIERLVEALGPVLLPAAVRAVIAGRSRLVLSPHRSLHLFPFHAIAWTDDGDGPPFLGTRRIVRYAPNLTSVVTPWYGRRQGPTLAVGVGRFLDKSLPPLPNAIDEAEAVAALYGEAGELRLDLTRAEFIDLPFLRYRVVHLATHGSSLLVGDFRDDPLGVGLALHDGTIDGWQLAAMDLPAEFVVLAACHSGQRAIGGRGLAALPGDDLLGMHGALFEAGAGSVLGTLWPIDDAAAGPLLAAVHRAFVDGADPDEALHRALRARLADGEPPCPRYSWAAFFVNALGNPRHAPADDPATHASATAPVA